MQCRRLVAQPIERRLNPRLELGKRSDGQPLHSFGVVRNDVELRAVARREAHRLAEPGSERRALLAVERHTFPQLDRCVMVRGADENETHHVKWATGKASRTRMTSTNPASAT